MRIPLQKGNIARDCGAVAQEFNDAIKKSLFEIVQSAIATFWLSGGQQLTDLGVEKIADAAYDAFRGLEGVGERRQDDLTQ